MGTGGNSHEAHTHRNGGRFIDRRPDRIGANHAAGHAAIVFVHDQQHHGDDASHTGRAAVHDDVAKHDEHDADAERRDADNHHQHKHDNDARRMPHTQGRRRTVCVPLRSDADWHFDR